jgi:hypothetical protein
MSLVGRHGYCSRPEQFLASDPAPKTPYRYLPMCYVSEPRRVVLSPVGRTT